MNNFILSEDVKNSIKSRFNELKGIYTKTLNEKGEVFSYLVRCECKNNDYITFVHYMVDDINDNKNKYIAMAKCIEKGDRYIKWLKKLNTSCLPLGQCCCSSTEKWNKFFKSELYMEHIHEYEKKFIDRVEKYYKTQKNILIFYM